MKAYIKLLTIFGAALLVLFPLSLCHAQNEVCPEIQRLVDSAVGGLDELKGPIMRKEPDDPEGADQCCYAKRNLPGAKFCTIKDSKFWDLGEEYTCFWNGNSAEEITSVFDKFADSLKACLPSDVWQNESGGRNVKFRASLNGGRDLATIEMQLNSRRRDKLPYITFSFQTIPRSASRIRK